MPQFPRESTWQEGVPHEHEEDREPAGPRGGDRRAGEYTRALRYCREALALFVEFGDRRREAGVWDSLGYITFRLGEVAQGRVDYERAITMLRELGDRYRVAETLTSLGNQYDRIARHDAAHRAWYHALTLLDELGNPVRAVVSS